MKVHELFKGLKGEISAWFIILAILPVLFIGIFAYYNFRQIVRENTYFISKAVIKNVMNEAEEWIESQERHLMLYSAFSQVRQWDLLGSEKILHDIMQKYNYQDVMLCNTSGDVVLSFDKKLLGKNVVDKKYFSSIKKNPNDPFITFDVKVQETKKELFIVLSIAVFDMEGNWLGALVLVPKAESLIKRIQEKLIKVSQNVFVLNKRGIILFAVNQSHELKKMRFHSYNNKVIRYLASSKSNFIGIYKNKNKEKIFGMGEYLKKLHWIVLVEEDYNVAMSPMVKLRNMLLFAYVFLVIVAGTIGWFFARGVSNPIEQISESAERISRGDFTFNPEVNSKFEVGAMADVFKSMVTNLCYMIGQVMSNAESIFDLSKDVSANTGEMQQAMNDMVATLRLISKNTAVEANKIGDVEKVVCEMTSITEKVDKDAEATLDHSQRTHELAEKGGEAVEDVSKRMESIYRTVSESAEVIKRLGERSQNIGKIITVITDVAKETNLLAINAAIEAARAGEAGLGFSIVAEEIRKLAEGSTNAAEEMSDMLGKIQEQTTEAVQSMDKGIEDVAVGKLAVEKTAGSLQEIIENVKETAKFIELVSTTSKEQVEHAKEMQEFLKETASSTEINQRAQEKAIESSQDVSLALKELTRHVQKLSGIGKRFMEVTSQFKLKDHQLGQDYSGGELEDLGKNEEKE